MVPITTWISLCALVGTVAGRSDASNSENDCGPKNDQPCGQARRTIVNGVYQQASFEEFPESVVLGGKDNAARHRKATYRAGLNDGNFDDDDSPITLPDHIPKSGKGSVEDIKARPWLGTLTGCLVFNPACVRFPEGKHSGYLLDDVDDAARNETRCLQRATEYHAWCGNDMVARTAAVFLETQAMEAYPPFGCAVFQRGCPRTEQTAAGGQDGGGGDDGDKSSGESGGDDEGALEGVFFDDYDDSFMNETRCLQRALDFRVYCHDAESPEAVSALYLPTAKHFSVRKMRAVDDTDAGSGGDGGAQSLTLNTTVRYLWPVSRAAPSFAATAVPLALFDLAGEYLDCRSPPMPLVDGKDAAKARNYHCNGPNAVLAAEALGIFVAVVPDHADAHYNRGVAYYSLLDLDRAASCFVSCLKLAPDHSLAMGALATVLTQQGRFADAWALLDARVRPQLPLEVIAAGADSAADAAKAKALDTPAVAGPAAGVVIGAEVEVSEGAAVGGAVGADGEKLKWWQRIGKPTKTTKAAKSDEAMVAAMAAQHAGKPPVVAAASSASSAVPAAGDAIVFPVGVSAPELVAWARLASRFGQRPAAIALLKAFVAQHQHSDDDAGGSASGGGGEDEEEAGRHADVNVAMGESHSALVSATVSRGTRAPTTGLFFPLQ